MSRFVDKKWPVPLVVGVASLVTGFAVGYILGRRGAKLPHPAPRKIEGRLDESSLPEIAAIEVEEDDFELLPVEKPADWGSPENVVITIEPHEDSIEQDIRDGIFAPNDGDWNYAEELKRRTKDVPYVLHRDEFFADEMDFLQVSYIYFAGDNVMVDEEEAPVYNYEQKTGPELKFGHGSGDEKVVYIRNERLEIEFEIVRDPGHYLVEVLGYTLDEEADIQRMKDLKHSIMKKHFPNKQE